MPESTAEMTIIDPLEGEVLNLRTSTPDRLGELLLAIREHESKLRELKQIVSNELHSRWDRDRKWSTVTPGGLKLSGKSDAPVVEWDVPGLIEELDRMAVEGRISREAVRAAVQERIEYKVMALGLTALLKSPDIAMRLEPFRQELPPPPRHVSVSRV